MSEKLGKSASFRLWQENQKRMEYAQNELKVNVSEVFNEMMEEYFNQSLHKHLKKKAQQIEAALSAPLP